MARSALVKTGSSRPGATYGQRSVVLLLVGLVSPIALLLLALVADLIVVLWAAYTLWHEEWSVDLGHAIRRIKSVPLWNVIHHQ